MYVDDLGKYENYRVLINSNAGILQGLYVEDSFTFGTQATLSSSAATDVESFARGAAAKVADKFVGEFAANKIKSEGSLTSQSQTWAGGSTLSFSFSINFFKRGKSALGTVASYKEVIDVTSKMTQTISSPLDPLQEPGYYRRADYALAVARNDLGVIESSLITASIGSWFRSRFLLCTGVNYTFSTHTDESNDPIFLQLNLSFETYRPLTADELASVITR